MKRSNLILVFVFLCSLSFAQTYESTGGEDSDTVAAGVMDAIRAPIDGIHKTHPYLLTHKPMDFAYVRWDDILYSTLTWSVIDLREKINHPLYFPTESRGNWKSLMKAITDAVTDSSEANPTPLYVYNDEYLTIPYTIEGLRAIMGESYPDDSLNDWGEVVGQKRVHIEWGAKDVFQYIIKDQYIIDKQRSVMEPRLLAICPMFWIERRDNTMQASNDDDDDMPAVTPRRWRPFGWLYYEEMRPTLVTTEVFNNHNNAQRRTYDDIFVQRRFSSFIKAVENVHNNRQINEYWVNGMDQRLEADAIKESIRYKEHEMWEF